MNKTQAPWIKLPITCRDIDFELLLRQQAEGNKYPSWGTAENILLIHWWRDILY